MTHVSAHGSAGSVLLRRLRDIAAVGGLLLLVAGLHAASPYSAMLLVGIAALSLATSETTFTKLSARLAMAIAAVVAVGSAFSGEKIDVMSGLQRYRQVIDLLIGLGLMRQVVGRSDLSALIRSTVAKVAPRWRRTAISSASVALSFPLSLATVPLVTSVVAPIVSPGEAAAASSMRAVTLTMLLAPTTLASAAIGATLPGLDALRVVELGLPLFVLGFVLTCLGRLDTREQSADRRPGAAASILTISFAGVFTICVASGCGIPASVALSGAAIFIGEQLAVLRSPATALADAGAVAAGGFAEMLLLLACGLLASFAGTIAGSPSLASIIATLWGGPTMALAWVTVVLPLVSATGVHPMIMFSVINPVVDNGLLGSLPCQYVAWAALFAYGQLLSPASVSAILAATSLGVSPADTSYRLHFRYVLFHVLLDFRLPVPSRSARSVKRSYLPGGGSLLVLLGFVLSAATLALPLPKAPNAPEACVAVASVPLHAQADISVAMRRIVEKASSERWCAHPHDQTSWKRFAAEAASPILASLPRLREVMAVTEAEAWISGVKVYVVRPDPMPSENVGRRLIYLHGGGFALSSGEAGTREAILTAGALRMEVISVDYRSALVAPFPAALDDVFSVWVDIARHSDPHKLGLLGTSAGGNIALALVMKAKRAGVPLPAALAVSTPWADLANTGDTVRTNERLDNVVVSSRGWLSEAALLYRGGRDARDPGLSPLYGSFAGFPPTMLTSGTRDLFLSDTVRVHRRLREARVDARLNVFESLSHGQHLADPQSSETKSYFLELSTFFNTALAK